MTDTPKQLAEKLRKAIHIESAKLSPHTSELIEVGKLVVEYLEGMAGLPAGEEWRSIETAPKDGTIVVLTWLDGGEPQEQWPMQWAHIQRNGLFPGKLGMWTAPDGSITWNDDDPAGGPTHWKPLPIPTGRSAIQSPTTGGET